MRKKIVPGGTPHPAVSCLRVSRGTLILVFVTGCTTEPACRFSLSVSLPAVPRPQPGLPKGRRGSEPPGVVVGLAGGSGVMPGVVAGMVTGVSGMVVFARTSEEYRIRDLCRVYSRGNHPGLFKTVYVQAISGRNKDPSPLTATQPDRNGPWALNVPSREPSRS